MDAFLIAAALFAQPDPTYLGGEARWAAFRFGDAHCEARGRAWRVLPDSQRARQPMISFVFRGNAQPMVVVNLRRQVREGTQVTLRVDDRPFLLEGSGQSAFADAATSADIIAALRRATRLRVRARSLSGSRFSDYYPLDGLPAAIDAAAAGCA